MFRVFTFFFLMSFAALASGSSDALKALESVFASSSKEGALAKYYKVEKVKIFADVMNELGSVESHLCHQNHDSMVFDTFACYITYTESSIGLVWEFYFFDEGGKWIGTNLGVIQQIENTNCISDISFKGGMGNGIDYEDSKCK